MQALIIIIILGLLGGALAITVLAALLKLVIMIIVPASILFIAYVIWKKA